MAIKGVFFDVGETLIDETRHWGEWADHLHVPHLTFFAALGALIGAGRHHREVFRLFDPGFDYQSAWEARRQAYEFLPSDFYPDAIPCLRELKGLGYVIGIAGNQPEDCEAALRKAGVEADIIASSATWGVEKPSAQFFQRIVESADLPAPEIAHVGDHAATDIEPAHRSGPCADFHQARPLGSPAQRRGRTGGGSDRQFARTPRRSSITLSAGSFSRFRAALSFRRRVIGKGASLA